MQEIKEIKVTNNYILIILSDKSKYKISEDDYFEYKFRAKQSINDKDLETLKRISNFHNAYLRALNRLKYKDRTEHEIRETMYDEFSLIKLEVDKIINKLKRYDFINDQRYAEEFIERSQYKLQGFNKIKDGLIKVRINSSLIEQTLIYDEEKEFDLALKFVEKSITSIKNHNNQQLKNKLRSRLLYRGFKSSLITRVINEIDIPYDEKAEKQLLKKDFNKIYQRYKSRYDEFELRGRLFNYLARRGYNYEIINELLDEMENYDE